MSGGGGVPLAHLLYMYRPKRVSLRETLPDDDPRVAAKKKEKGRDKIVTTMTPVEPGPKAELTLSSFMRSSPKWKDKKNRDIERVVHKIVFNGVDSVVDIPVNKNNVIGVEVAARIFPAACTSSTPTIGSSTSRSATGS